MREPYGCKTRFLSQNLTKLPLTWNGHTDILGFLLFLLVYQEKKMLETQLQEMKEQSLNFFQKRDEIDELEGFQQQEIAKVKHMVRFFLNFFFSFLKFMLEYQVSGSSAFIFLAFMLVYSLGHCQNLSSRYMHSILHSLFQQWLFWELFIISFNSAHNLIKRTSFNEKALSVLLGHLYCLR